MDRDRDAECKYEPRRRARPTGTANALSTSLGSTPPPLSARILPFQTRAGGFSSSESSTSPRSDLPVLSRSNPTKSDLPPSLPPAPFEGRPSKPKARLPRELPPASHIHDSIAPCPSSDVSVVRYIHNATKRVPHPVPYSFTILPSIHLRTIPRPLQIPLSFIPPEHVQVSRVAGSDMDMT